MASNADNRAAKEYCDNCRLFGEADRTEREISDCKDCYDSLLAGKPIGRILEKYLKRHRGVPSIRMQTEYGKIRYVDYAVYAKMRGLYRRD